MKTPVSKPAYPWKRNIRIKTMIRDIFRFVLLVMMWCLFCCSTGFGEETGMATSGAGTLPAPIDQAQNAQSVTSKPGSPRTDLKKYFLDQLTTLCDKIEKAVPEDGTKRQEELKRQLLEQMPVLYSQMAVGTDPKNVEGWKAFLLTEEVIKTLKAAKLDHAILESSLESFQGREAGLDNPMFVPVRKTLKNLVELNRKMAVDAKSREEDKKYISGLCRELPTNVRKLAQKYDAELSESITLALEDLKYYRPDSNDVRQLVDLISAYFSVPNVMFSVGSNLLVTGAARPVSEDVDINDVIRGAYVTGKGHVNGNLFIEFVPNPQMAEIMLSLKTQVDTNTVAARDGAYVYSTNTGTVQAKKSIFVGKEMMTGQATASGVMASQITGVNSGRGNLGQNIAEQRVMEEKPYSEMESTRKMEYRIASRLNEEVDSQVKAFNDSLRERFISKLEQQEYFPRAIVSKTTTDRLFWSALVANEVQLGLPTSTMGNKDGEMKGDVSILVHESSPNNAAFFALAGRRVSDKEVTKNISGFMSKESSEDTSTAKDTSAVDEKKDTTKADAKETASATSGKDRKVGKLGSNRNKRTKSETKPDTKTQKKPEVKSETKKAEDTPLWLSFTGDLPIVTTFDKDEMRFSLRIDQFEKDERTYPGLDVNIVYAIAKNGTCVFHRKEIDVFPAGLKRGQVIPARYQAIRSMVLKRLEEQLEKEIVVQKISTTQMGSKTSKEPLVRKGELIPNIVTARNGWFLLQYKFVEDKAK